MTDIYKVDFRATAAGTETSLRIDARHEISNTRYPKFYIKKGIQEYFLDASYLLNHQGLEPWTP